MKECVKLPTCAFFELVTQNKKIIDVLDEYTKVYCRGPFQDKCERLKHFREFGVLPGNTISPAGLDFIQYISEQEEDSQQTINE